MSVYQERNIFVGREAQIRRGNYTDILVEANPFSDEGGVGAPLTVVIEVKGCWNPDLKTAIQNQLVDQYLAPHGHKHGMFLVGRFLCDKWERQDDDNRWRASQNLGDTVLLHELPNQARALASMDFDIRVFVLDAFLI